MEIPDTSSPGTNDDAGSIFNLLGLMYRAPDNHNRFKSIFTQLPVAIVVLKGDNHIIDSVNDVNLAIWGKSEEVIGKPLLEVMPEFSDPAHLQILDKVYKKGEPAYFKELPIELKKDNELKTGYYTVEYQPLRDAHHTITGIVIAGFDVTGYVIARQQLEESGQQFKNIIAHAPVSIAMYRGRNVVFEFANEDYLQKVDKTYDELIGKPFFEVLPEFKGQGLEEIIDEVLTTGKPYYTKAFSASYTRYGRKDRYYSNFVYYPLRNTYGEIDGFMVILNDISDLIQSNKVIEESERQLRNLIMQSPVAMGTLRTREWVVDLANDALLKIWERTKEEVYGQRLLDVFPELHNQPFTAWMERVYDTGEVFNEDEVIMYARTPEGNMVEKYVQLCFAPLLDAHNTISGIIITANNITAQVHARKQLEENEHYFRKMADNVPVIVFVWKSDGFCTYKNKRWFEYTGASDLESQGFSWLNYVDINSRPGVQQTLFNAIKNKASLKIEFQLKGKNGKFRWFEEAVAPRFDINGQIEGYIGTLTDIHERKLAEEQLKDAEERLRLAAEATGMATFDMDMQTFDIVHSSSLFKIYGIEKETSENKPAPRSFFLNRLHPEDISIVENALHRAYQTGSFHYEARILWPDQSIHWIKTEGKIFYSHSNKPMRMIGMVEDITRRKQLEQHKDDFMGIVSHELKTPVTSLKVYTQMLQEQFETSSDVTSATMLQRMDSQINKLNLLIKDLLDTARIDTGTLQVANQLFDLNTILNEVIEEASLTSSTHRIVKKNNQPFLVMGDAARTSQVIFNLISNAIKYSPQAHDVIVDTVQKDKYVVCCVQDFGMGIAPNSLPNVFEKYFRINNKTLGTYPGLGLSTLR